MDRASSDVREVMGLIPVGDVMCLPLSHARVMLISSLFKFNFVFIPVLLNALGKQNIHIKVSRIYVLNEILNKRFFVKDNIK